MGHTTPAYTCTPFPRADTSFRDVGINLAVATMRVGEVARIFVHPKYGYGEKGNFSFPMVPPSAELVYELELLAYENENNEVGGVRTPMST